MCKFHGYLSGNVLKDSIIVIMAFVLFLKSQTFVAKSISYFNAMTASKPGTGNNNLQQSKILPFLAF